MHHMSVVPPYSATGTGHERLLNMHHMSVVPPYRATVTLGRKIETTIQHPISIQKSTIINRKSNDLKCALYDGLH
jgi:hypothetical protein